MSAKIDTITITIRGTKGFRQKIMDLVYKALNDEDLQFAATKHDNGFTLESSISPSEEAF
jgi:hypothetical protein